MAVVSEVVVGVGTTREVVGGGVAGVGKKIASQAHICGFCWFLLVFAGLNVVAGTGKWWYWERGDSVMVWEGGTRVGGHNFKVVRGLVGFGGRRGVGKKFAPQAHIWGFSWFFFSQFFCRTHF